MRRTQQVINLLGCLFLLTGSVASFASPQKNDRPNILLIIADDLGFTDIGSFGGEIPTPHLDKLAFSGMRFSNFHTMPACSPTRATLFTGVDPHLAGVGNMYEELSPNQKGQPGYEGFLNDRVVSVATLLKNSGYRTYLSGKWHLAVTPDQGPTSQGFERSFSLISGAASHFSDMRPAYAATPDAKAPYVEDGKLLTELPENFEYSSQFYVDKLISYLEDEADSDKPFFSVLSFTAPHWPLQAPDAVIEKYHGAYSEGYDVVYDNRLKRVRELGILPQSPDPTRPPKAVRWNELNKEEKIIQQRSMEVYAAMVEEIDRHTGRLINYLESTEVLDNTLILFFSDNGPEGHDLDETWSPDLFPKIRQVIDEQHDFSLDAMGKPGSYVLYGAGWARAGAAGLRMYKAFPSEGGTRVSAFAHLPGHVAPGEILHSTLSVRDVTPTLLDFAGIEHPGNTFEGKEIHPMQGNSFRTLLSNPKADISINPLGIELFGKYALRDGDWKLLLMPKPYATGDVELYYLPDDPGETNNLALKKPEKLASMIEKWKDYQRKNNVILPDWVSGY